MTLERARLEMDAKINGEDVNGVFEMVGNLSVAEMIKPNYLVDSALGNTNAVVSRVLGNQFRGGIFFDLGAGTHQFEISFNGWEGAKDGDGNDVTWGDTSKAAGTVWNGTGERPITQIQVFNSYLREGTYDSNEPARLYVGEYSSQGDSSFPDKINVVPQQPRGVHAAEDYSTFDGNYTFVECVEIDVAIDILERLGL